MLTFWLFFQNKIPYKCSWSLVSCFSITLVSRTYNYCNESLTCKVHDWKLYIFFSIMGLLNCYDWSSLFKRNSPNACTAGGCIFFFLTNLFSWSRYPKLYRGMTSFFLLGIVALEKVYRNKHVHAHKQMYAILICLSSFLFSP